MPESEAPLLLHEYLRQSARRRAGSPAIVEEGRITSFDELLKNATSVAATLLARGLEKGDRVALVLSKSTEAITSLFATLLGGAVYVPLPPRWPAARVESSLRDCSPRFAIVEPDGETDPQPVLLDLQAGARIRWREALATPETPLATPAIQPEDPALILFTSGSTGRPKGVMLSHRAVGTFVKWSAQEFQVRPDDRLACPSPLSFDLSTFDIFNMALCGATCVIVPEQIVWMPRFLAQFARDQRITAWYSVPSILAGMLNEGSFGRGACPDLRLILFAGEVFSSRNLARLQAAVPHAVCCNLYGPTETNVVAWCRLPEDFDPSGPVPIGGPCPYAQLLLDPATVEAQDGRQIGELLVGGESLMNGYWNRPEETERAFVQVSGGDAAGGRFYRTGDRVSQDSRGEYTFVGRLDRQVKRRGFRIELGEIEAALGRHPGVQEAAVISSADQERGTIITALVRSRPQNVLSPVEMKTHCAQFLPSYMMPDQIVFIEVMPKGSRGKIDYAALREWHAG